MKFPLRLRERFKGFFLVSGAEDKPKRFNPGEKSWEARCKHYGEIYDSYGLAKAQILTVAGQLVANDISFQPVDGSARAKEAVKACEDWNAEVNMRSLLYDGTVSIGKYGSCFWERTYEPEYRVRMMPQIEKVEPHEVNEINEVDSWRVRYGTSNPTVFKAPEEIIPTHWNVSSASWPYGNSILTGIDTEFEIKSKLEENISRFVEKQAFPKEVVAVGDRDMQPSNTDVSAVRSQWRNWNPGQTVVTSFPVKYIAGGTTTKNISNLAEILGFIKDDATDAMMIPPISKQYSSTEASARAMMPWARTNLIQPIQWLWSNTLEKTVYPPLLMLRGYSVKLTPRILWMPKDQNFSEDAVTWSALVTSGICPPRWAAQKLGIPLDEFDRWQEEKQKLQMEQMQAQKLNPLSKGGSKVDS